MLEGMARQDAKEFAGGAGEAAIVGAIPLIVKEGGGALLEKLPTLAKWLNKDVGELASSALSKGKAALESATSKLKGLFGETPAGGNPLVPVTGVQPPVAPEAVPGLNSGPFEVSGEPVGVHQTAGIEYTVKRPSGVTDAQWQKKLDALNKGAELGRAKVVHDPVRTGTAQKAAREEGLVDAADDADHGLDLQFGGEDAVGEIISTNPRVNRSIGGQGKARKQYPDGTPIVRFKEAPPAPAPAPKPRQVTPRPAEEE
jgi:hypothetical protein